MQYATQLGKTLAAQGIGLVYGGAQVGLMGAVADSVLANNGTVIGVLPRFLAEHKEVPHQGLTELILVDTMHERKIKMHELCNGFITMPGGFGTLEEFFEVLSWNKMKLNYKPLGLLNIDGFYDGLITFADNLLHNEFINGDDRKMMYASSDITELLGMMRSDPNVMVSNEKDIEKLS
jgi:uncharacterized protein (TIGR00730 family)